MIDKEALVNVWKSIKPKYLKEGRPVSLIIIKADLQYFTFSVFQMLRFESPPPPPPTHNPYP